MAGSAQSICLAWFFWFIVFSQYSSGCPANDLSLVVGKNHTVQLSHGFPVEKSPGLKPGASVICERVRILGLPRIHHLRKFANSMKVKILPSNLNIRLPIIEVCFHRNASLAVGMCPQGQWEKVAKGSWTRSMSPFENKLLDIRTGSPKLENFEISIEEEFFPYRILLLVLGIILLSLASTLSKSLAFYYSSAMAIGILLVVLVILFQGMKLLPTGRTNSLAIFLYSSAVGLGTFLLRYVPGLLHALFVEMGIDEDMYYPLATFLLAFVAIAGAWLGFWVVRRLVLKDDGTLDISTSSFVAWSLRILAGVMILQSSADIILATVALVCGAILSSFLRRMLRLRLLRRLSRNLFKSPTKNRKRPHFPEAYNFDDLQDSYVYKKQNDEASKLRRPTLQDFSLASCQSSGLNRTPPQQLSKASYPSTFHTTPERRKFSKAEWHNFTQESTEKALEGLVASPEFSKWLHQNADRITVSPKMTIGDRLHKWLRGS